MHVTSKRTITERNTEEGEKEEKKKKRLTLDAYLLHLRHLGDGLL